MLISSMPGSTIAKILLPGWSSKKCLAKQFYEITRNCSNFGYWDPAQFRPRRAVILTKVGRIDVLRFGVYILEVYSFSAVLSFAL